MELSSAEAEIQAPGDAGKGASGMGDARMGRKYFFPDAMSSFGMQSPERT